jgi:hypothetical protein
MTLRYRAGRGSPWFRLRHAAGPDIANEALRRWLRLGGKPADLMRLTSIFPAAKPALLHTPQVLL